MVLSAIDLVCSSFTFQQLHRSVSKLALSLHLKDFWNIIPFLPTFLLANQGLVQGEANVYALVYCFVHGDESLATNFP